MKLIISAIAFLFGTAAAQACPDLTGTFSCPDGDGGFYTTVISQEKQNGYTVYTMDGESYVANGEPQYFETEEDGFVVIGSRTVSCEGESTRMTENSIWYMDGVQVGTADILAAVKRTGVDLNTSVVGTVEFNGQKQNINQSNICRIAR